jgi:2-dehydropantoate 2-reductase
VNTGFKDIERNAPIEAEQIVGDLLPRAAKDRTTDSLLQLASAHLRGYDARRAREAATAKSK